LFIAIQPLLQAIGELFTQGRQRGANAFPETQFFKQGDHGRTVDDLDHVLDDGFRIAESFRGKGLPGLLREFADIVPAHDFLDVRVCKTVRVMGQKPPLQFKQLFGIHGGFLRLRPDGAILWPGTGGLSIKCTRSGNTDSASVRPCTCRLRNPPTGEGCSAILWLRTNTGTTSNYQLMHHLRNTHGIRSARQMCNKPMMMMVRYCPDDLNLKHTLDHFGQEGALLRRVGC